MGKSLNRVKAAIKHHDLPSQIHEVGQGKTAQEAADSVGCHLDQIAKSILFCSADQTRVFLFLTAGGNRVDIERASTIAGEPLQKGDAAIIRKTTGFAIGGVSPLGHLNPCPIYADPRLLEFDTVYGAAGTPNHVFDIASVDLMRVCNAQVIDFTCKSK